MSKLVKIACAAGVAAALAGCQTAPPREAYDAINAQMRDAVAKAPAPAAAPASVQAALLPPMSSLSGQMPQARAVLEERFNVAFNNVPVQQFFNSIVAGTRYNMLINPEVSGNITAHLKDVTLFEALDAIRELYGYDYRVEGTRIYIKPLTMQTRMFHVNYLTVNRKGTSNVRVASTSVASAGAVQSGGSGGSNGGQQNQQQNQQNQPGQGPNAAQLEDAANVKTTSGSDFWVELKQALEAIVGGQGEGRSVIINAQSGVVLVRAMPEQLRNIDQYLKATQLSVERQVILEAKILEVELNNGFQSGVNWAGFGNYREGKNRLSTGVISPGTGLSTLTPGSVIDSSIWPAANAQASGSAVGIGAIAGSTLTSAANSAGTLFGLAFQANNFAAMISFLESQGSVHVLSSPRIATLNNQKAVLKIGTDEFYVTGVSTSTSSNVSGSTSSPNVTLQPFFSGVVLDVTPQIDEEGNIMLHVHPSVSQVTTVNKVVNLGVAGSLNLPLPSSNTSEMDSMVRGQDGRIVAIGGLMRQATSTDRSQVPGAGDVPLIGSLFRNTNQSLQKRELVVLIKPTIVDSANSWSQDMMDANRRFEQMAPLPAGDKETR